MFCNGSAVVTSKKAVKLRESNRFVLNLIGFVAVC